MRHSNDNFVYASLTKQIRDLKCRKMRGWRQRPKHVRGGRQNNFFDWLIRKQQSYNLAQHLRMLLDFGRNLLGDAATAENYHTPDIAALVPSPQHDTCRNSDP